MATAHAEQVIAEVAERLRLSPPIGAVSVVSATGRLSSGSEGEPVVRFEIVLEDPPEPEQSWDPYQLFNLRQRLRRFLAEADDELPPLVVDFRPRTPDPDEDGDDGDGAGVFGEPNRQ